MICLMMGLLRKLVLRYVERLLTLCVHSTFFIMLTELFWSSVSYISPQTDSVGVNSSGDDDDKQDQVVFFKLFDVRILSINYFKSK